MLIISCYYNIILCQNSVVGAVEYGQSAGVRSVRVSDVWMQGSKTRLKLMCFALATRTGMSLYFGESELRQGIGIGSEGRLEIERY